MGGFEALFGRLRALLGGFGLHFGGARKHWEASGFIREALGLGVNLVRLWGSIESSLA